VVAAEKKELEEIPKKKGAENGRNCAPRRSGEGAIFRGEWGEMQTVLGRLSPRGKKKDDQKEISPLSGGSTCHDAQKDKLGKDSEGKGALGHGSGLPRCAEIQSAGS